MFSFPKNHWIVALKNELRILFSKEKNSYINNQKSNILVCFFKCVGGILFIFFLVDSSLIILTIPTTTTTNTITIL